MNVIDFIPFGKQNAITQNELMMVTGLSDRMLREEISRLRRDVPILNMQDGKGYFRPTEDEIEDVKKYISQEERRGKSVFWSLKGAREFIKNEKHTSNWKRMLFVPKQSVAWRASYISGQPWKEDKRKKRI